MGSGRAKRKKRRRARVRELEARDALRRLELADTVATLAEAQKRCDRLREQLDAATGAKLVSLTETDYPTEGF